MTSLCTGKELLKKLKLTAQSTPYEIGYAISKNPTSVCGGVLCSSCIHYKQLTDEDILEVNCEMIHLIQYVLEALNEKT
jgi:hypothetical protein